MFVLNAIRQKQKMKLSVFGIKDRVFMARFYPEIIDKASEQSKQFTISNRTRQYKKGPIENWVKYKLQILGVHFLKMDVCVTIDNHRYEPDLVYVDKEKGIYIDIEIDEPYKWNRKPCHYLNQDGTSRDINRDKMFTSAGWTVIRFSERQIFSETKSCMGLIAEVISQMDRSFADEHSNMIQWGKPTEEKRWDMPQSLQMARQNSREEYLGFTPGKINLEEVMKFAGHELGAIFSGRWLK